MHQELENRYRYACEASSKLNRNFLDKPKTKLPPRIVAKMITPNETLQSIHFRFYLDRVSYNLLHLRCLTQKVRWEVGHSYTIHFHYSNKKWIRVIIRIVYVNKFKLGMRVIHCPGLFKHYIGQLLLEHYDTWTPKQLTSLQFPVQSIKNAVDYSIVQYDVDYKQAVALRTKAYKIAGKLPPKAPLMQDEFDQRSLIIVAKHGKHVVATMRIISCQDHERFEHERSLLIPKQFPKRTDILEITRVCTHPDYRGSDLLEGLFQYAAFVAMSQNHSWIFSSSTTELLPMYQRLGFTTLPIKFRHCDLGPKNHTLFYGNKKQMVAGYKVDPITWSLVYRDVYDWCCQSGIQLHSKWSLTASLRIHLYQLISIIVQAIVQRYRVGLMRKYNLNEV